LTVGSFAISASSRPSHVPTPVSAETVLPPVGQQRFLGEAPLVEQQRHALAHRELALLARLAAMVLGPALKRALARVAQRAHRSSLR
jgi:hypothetical protein